MCVKNVTAAEEICIFYYNGEKQHCFSMSSFLKIESQKMYESQSIFHINPKEKYWQSRFFNSNTEIASCLGCGY